MAAAATGRRHHAGDEYVYSGLHAFVFFDHSTTGASVSQVVMDLQEASSDDGPIVFATEAVGVFKGFAHFRVDEGDLAGLQDLIATTLFEKGVGCEFGIEGPYFVDANGTALPAKPRHCEVLGFVRIWVEPGQARNVLGRLGGELGPVFHGASIVFGGFDILLVLDAPDYASVAEAALERVNGIPGIVRTETSFADIRRYPRYREDHS